MVRIFLFVCFYPILPILYFMLRNACIPKKNLILGVTLPYNARQDENVAAISRSFKRYLNGTAGVLAMLPFGMFLIPYTSVSTTYLMTWLLAAIVLPFVPYTICHRKLMRLKMKMNWINSGAGHVFIDTQVSQQSQRRLHMGWFLPSVLISIMPVVSALYEKADGALVIMYSVNALFVVASILFYHILYRPKSEVIDSHTALSVALTQVRRYHWGRVWIAIAWLTGLFNLLLWLFVTNATGVLISSAVYTAVLLLAVIHAEFALRKAQERLTEHSGKESGANHTHPYVDDDVYWINGMFYYNPHDSHTIVNNRIGVGTTINLARPAGKGVLVAALLAVMTMPFIGLMMMNAEFTPVRIVVSDTAVAAQHTSPVYRIDLAQIRAVDILETCTVERKLNGLDMDTVLRGRFRIAETGSSELCLNPMVPPYIMIQTDDTIYLLGSHDGDETRRIYAWVAAQVE